MKLHGFIGAWALCMALFLPLSAANPPVTASSPDGRLGVAITADGHLSYSVTFDGETLLEPSVIGITTMDGTSYGSGKLRKVSRRSVDESFPAVAYKRSTVRDRFNEVTLQFKECRVIFRAYDDCIAYRFVSLSKVPFKVKSENAAFNFAGDWNAFVPYTTGIDGIPMENYFHTSFESHYTHGPLSEVRTDHPVFLPVMVEAPGGKKINIMESALYNYPGMYLLGTGGNVLKGQWAPVPDEIEQGGHNMLQGQVKSYKDCLAECGPMEEFPWRIVAVSEKDVQMADNDIVYRLGDAPAQGSDWSWLRPGKVAWDWWNDWNIKGVDFESGINTETYKYYIDFAAANGIEYVIMDEGWAVNMKADLMQVVPEIDLPEIVRYGQSKGVGIVLWAGYWAFNRDMEEVCRHFSAMGVKGFKIDFMDRDDQPMVAFYEKAAATAAKYHLFVDFHGAFKPVGLCRKYPNVLNYEGVFGLENMKWAPEDTDQPRYDVTIPFIRMAAGRMDYTQGAMKNAARHSYHPFYSSPMSMGTRCHQLAEYVVFDSPFCMLCDSPSNYMGEPESLEYIAKIPTVFDESLGIDGEVGEYIVMARKKDGVWYVGGTTNWTARDYTLDLTFLGEGAWEAEIFRDGANAHREGTDYKREFRQVGASDALQLHLAPAGGFAIVLRPR